MEIKGKELNNWDILNVGGEVNFEERIIRKMALVKW